MNKSHNYIELNNGVKIPHIAFGVGRINGSTAKDITVEAINSGFRLIDSARGYGNQDVVGDAIQHCITDAKIKRSDIMLTQKLGGTELGYDNVLKAFGDGCKSYNTDYIDIMLIYFPHDYNPYWKRYIIDSWRALEKLYEEGKVKVIGVSNFNFEHLDFLFHYAKIKPMINQIELHPFYQQRLVVNLCKAHNIQIEAWSPLMYVINNNLLKELGLKYNKTSAQIALKWSVQKGYIPVCSTKIAAEMEQNLNIFDFNIEPDDIVRIDSLDGGMHSIDNQITPPLNACDIISHIFYKQKPYVRNYKLFNVIPFLKKKKYRWNRTQWFLFGFIPLMKITTKEK